LRLDLAAGVCFQQVATISNSRFAIRNSTAYGGSFAVGLVDHSRGEFDPGAIVPEAGIGTDGAEDGVGGDGGGLSLLNEDIEDGADVLVAAGFEAEGVRVAVDDRPVRQRVVFDDFVGAMPVEEIVFDLGALRVMTDLALTGMASEVGPWWAELAASGDFVDLHVRSFLL
jgi:hypothetical protein